MASNTGRGMASLYADLLEPKSGKPDQPSTISKSPVIFAPGGAAQLPPNDTASGSDQLASAKKQVSSAALRFQPIPRRPQPNQQKTVKRAGISTFAKQSKPDAPNDHNQESAPPSSTAAVATRAPVVKSTLEDWATNDDDDVNGFYASRQRGGRKRRKKNKEKDLEKAVQSWDDIYDPSRPNQYEEYKDSEEKDQEMRDWRDRLYGRRQAFSSDESEDEPARFSGKGFAPPASFGFAPPPNLDQPSMPEPRNEPAPMLDAATGDEIWMMRARMTQSTLAPTGTASVAPQDREPPPPPPEDIGGRPSMPTSAVGSSSVDSATISRAPVIYSLPPAPPDLGQDSDFDQSETFEDEDEDTLSASAQEADAPRSNRPGQKGFAERLMSKYGWTKGTGLGANSSGMVHALQVKANKGKDAKGVGKILDKNKKRSDDGGKFGKMSEVVVLHKMVDGLEGEDPAVLMQEIGDECSEKYGRIERVHIVHKQSEDTPSKVFVQFTSQLSALRAVNALEGRMFNGNTIEARFFDADEFEAWLHN
ncbi:hypothetical protein TWF718_005539 [Orbilia javanica]|uniref:G-patch domain-containing protein n=1 Tax=Orbilia javanica TaxID=47235 RepID=A0AAN8MV41_9PEZI